MTEPQDDPEVLTSRTAAGLLMFYDVKEKQHELAEGVVSSLRTATKRVLEVADDPKNVDLTTLDLDELFVRFHNKSSTRLTDKSYAAYTSRFRRGMTMYLRWLDRDQNWRGKVRSSASTNSIARTARNAGRFKNAATNVPSTPTMVDRTPVIDTVSSSVTPSQDELFDYPVALVDSKVTAILKLPRTYTEADAARMAALINALAVPGSPLPSSDV